MTDTPSLISDVDATIRYWRNTGVLAAEIGKQLKCHAGWPAIRATMIAIALAEIDPRAVRPPASARYGYELAPRRAA